MQSTCRSDRPPSCHPSLTIDGETFRLSHLSSFTVVVPGKGKTTGADLTIEVFISNHVVTERSGHGDPRHVQDHHGTWRKFDRERYDMSLTLQRRLKDHIVSNTPTHVSKSYGGRKNLVVVEAGKTKWTVIFCFKPSPRSDQVEMHVLSAHSKEIHERNIKREHLLVFARRCLYSGNRVP